MNNNEFMVQIQAHTRLKGMQNHWSWETKATDDRR